MDEANQNDEYWRNFPDDMHFSRFEISNFGNVRDKYSKTIRKRTKHKKAKKLYCHLTKDDGKITTVCVAFWVASLFVPNPNPSELKKVTHIDGNVENNKATNLRWEKWKRMNQVKNPNDYTYIPISQKKSIAKLPIGVCYYELRNFYQCTITINGERFIKTFCVGLQNQDEVKKKAIEWIETKKKEKELKQPPLISKKRKRKNRMDRYGNKLPKHISFIDKGNRPRYVVSLKSLSVSKVFSFLEYGGQQNAFEAAKKLLDKYIDKHEGNLLKKRTLIGQTSSIETKKSWNDFNRLTRNRGLNTKLSFEEWKMLVEVHSCLYCGSIPSETSRQGVDRYKNEDKTYAYENSVGCCASCNMQKGIVTFGSYMAHLRMILLNHAFKIIYPPFVFSPGIIKEIVTPTVDALRRRANIDVKIMDCKNEKQNLLRFQKLCGYANRKNRKVIITFEEFVVLINSNCYYCNRTCLEVNIGLDRVDSFKEYSKDNVLPCCYGCNVQKGPNDVKSFFEKCESILINQGFTLVPNDKQND